jgi:protein SCO1/2
VIGLLATLALAAGCAGNSGSGAGAQARAVQTVASGNTLDQKVPAAAAGTRLVDQDGRVLSLRSLHGKVVVLAPLLTMCQETCPMTSENMHRAAAEQPDVVFLEVTVDPERDTVRRIRAYARLYGGLPNWRLATGSPAAVVGLWKALGVSTAKTKPEDTVRDWMTGRLVHDSYDVHHQDCVMIIDPAGRLRWITVGHPDARGTRLPESMQKFLSDEGRQNYAHPGAGDADSWTARDVEQAVAYVHNLGG